MEYYWKDKLLYKNGIVYIAINSYTLSSASVYYDTNTLPAGYRPAVNICCICQPLSSSASIIIRFETDGKIHVYGAAGTASQTYNGFCSFPYGA